MHEFPHHYSVLASGDPDHDVTLEADRLPSFRAAVPPEFGGAGGAWSPETLLVAAIASCFVLTFRGVAKASRVSWTSLACDVNGTLDRVEGVTRFTHVAIRVLVSIPEGTSEDQTRRALERAERGCLIVNSLKAVVQCETDVAVVPTMIDAA